MKNVFLFGYGCVMILLACFLSSCYARVNYGSLLAQVYLPDGDSMGKILREELTYFGDIHLCIFRVGNAYDSTDDYLVSYDRDGNFIDGMNLGFGYLHLNGNNPEAHVVECKLVSDKAIDVWNITMQGQHFKRTELNRVSIDGSGKLHLRPTGIQEEGTFISDFERRDRFLWKIYELCRIPLSDDTKFDQWNRLGDAKGIFADDLSNAVQSVFFRNPKEYFQWMLKKREADSLTLFIVSEDSLRQVHLMNLIREISDEEDRQYVMDKVLSVIND